jgi:hypothetical protein
VTGIATGPATAAAIAVLSAAAAWSQPSRPPVTDVVACEELRSLMETEEKVRKSLGWIEEMGQTLLDQAKRKNEEIDACSKSGSDPSSCTADLQARREDEVRRLMGQVRELRATRTAIEQALKEATERLRELTETMPGKDGCPNAKR